MDDLREVQAGEKRLPNGRAMIYALADPSTREIRYIGQTIVPGRRRWMHSSLSNNKSGRRLCRWVRNLIEKGAAPLMLELEIVSDADEAEARWIEEYNKRGANLLNMNSGVQAMEQCRLSPRANTKGAKRMPLHVAMTRLVEDAKILRKLLDPESFARIAEKRDQVLAAVKRAEKREGKRVARDRINRELMHRSPVIFGA